jgi:hypothetical protein
LKQFSQKTDIIINLSVFVDGVNTPFRSTDYSIWPIFAAIDELDYQERYKLSNVLTFL